MEILSLINCENLSFAYDGCVVVENLNFCINEKDYICIVGENGSGKSTLVKGLLSLIKPFSGTLSFVENFNSSYVGYVPQISDVQKDFPASVFEVVLSGLLNDLKSRPFYSKKEKKIALEKIELLGLSDLKNSCYRELSGGQQRRVLLARSLCASKKILILDEPTAGLDPIMVTEFYELINRINKDFGITIVMVSHDVKQSLQYADKVLHIRKKQLFFGSSQEYQESTIGREFIASIVA